MSGLSGRPCKSNLSGCSVSPPFKKSPTSTTTILTLTCENLTEAMKTRDFVNDSPSHRSLARSPRLMVYEFQQDDPKKCTSARLRKFQVAHGLRSLRQIPPRSIVLNPTGTKTLSREDRGAIIDHGLVGLDCSWNHSEEIFDRNIRGDNKRLPLLLAGNPTSYGIVGRLSTAEALAAALILTGFPESAHRILSLFKWGPTFLALNKEPLEKYSNAQPSDLSIIEREYFSTTP